MAKRVRYKEDLIPRIRDLIDGYTSSSILKEYLQNADDSGATEINVNPWINQDLIPKAKKIPKYRIWAKLESFLLS